MANNILWAESGYVLRDESYDGRDVDSDYNLLVFPRDTASGGLALLGERNYENLDELRSETPLEQNSQAANPLFVSVGGEDGVIGFSTTPVASPLIIDDEDAAFSRVGSDWLEKTDVGFRGGQWQSSDEDASATWLFSDLTPGTYQVTTSVDHWQNQDSVTYTLSNHDGRRFFANTSSDFAPEFVDEGGTRWHVIANLIVTGTTLEIQSHERYRRNGLVADAIRIQQIIGDKGADDMAGFELQTSSPGLDSGAPGSHYFAEPNYGAGRANIGAFGNTPNAATSDDQLVRIISPNGLEKIEESQTFEIQWSSWGLAPVKEIALINAGGHTVGGGESGFWSLESLPGSGLGKHYI